LTAIPRDSNHNVMDGPLDESIHFSLAAATDGFLSDAQQFLLGPEPEQGLLLKARYNIARFSPSLFARLDILRPDSLARAVDKRLAEFLAGRILAQAGQQALGHVPLPVQIGDDRAPVWPAGLAGSISHTRDHCACLVLPAYGGHPGVDIESIASGPGLETILKFTMNPAEAALLTGCPDYATAATLCFSAKETLFKALYPVVGRFFGFECAELHDMPGPDRIRLTLTETLHADLPAGISFDIDCRRLPTHVVTWLVRRH
jgi:enterobactin synthetase component D